jgi:hypothetical protein
VCRHEIGIEVDQRVAGAHLVANRPARREAPWPFSETVSRPLCVSTSIPVSVMIVTA